MSEVFQKILVMSDPHLTCDGEKIIGLDPSEKLKRALRHALEAHSDASYLVFTGDLAHTGSKKEYLSLKEILSDISIDTKLMMGNHDNRKNCLDVFPAIQLDENGFFQSSLVCGNYKLLFLDTMDVSATGMRKNEGFLCDLRLRWLEDQLKLEKNRELILFMHHPPFSVGFKGMDKIKLLNSDDFFKILDSYKNVVQIISGHIHRNIAGCVKGYSFSIFKSTCHQMPILFGTDNVKLSAAEPPGYGLLCLSDDGIILHNEDYELSGKQTQPFEKY